MGWLSRLAGKSPPLPRRSGEENILVISDMHLGEDVLTTGPEYLGDYIRALNRELAEFVAAHIEHRDARPWHLVINGDMFDFVKVSLEPDPEEISQQWSRHLGDEERAELPATLENIVWKLGRILEIHRPLFKELARFILAGNRLTIVEGNHDAEFYFEEVRVTLVEFIIKEAQKQHKRDKAEGEFNADPFVERIAFCPWFVASSGRYHIEHGHQYDQFSSFEHNLAPVERSHGQAIATPMSHRLMPYFAELLGDFSSHGVDTWPFAKWIKFIVSHGPKMTGILIYVYFGAMWQLLRQAGPKRKKQLSPLEQIHDSHLEALARGSQYGYQTLRALERLCARPAEYSVARMIHLFCLDRFIVGAAMILALLVGAIVGGSGGLLFAGVSTLVGITSLLILGGIKATPVERSLRQAAANIADETGARYIVFGHSHNAELINLEAAFGIGRFGESAFYINSGSWVTREILLGEAGNGMTYVEITADGAALKRWIGAGEEPAVLRFTGTGRGAVPVHPTEATAAESETT